MRRIERHKFVFRHTGKACCKFEIEMQWRFHFNKIGLVGHWRKSNVKGCRIGNDLPKCHKFWYVMPRFLGHIERKIISRPTASLISSHGLANSTFTPVIRRKRKKPIVALQLVNALQVVERRLRGVHWISSIVDPPILRKIIGFTRRRNELPKSRGLRRRNRGRVHRTLYKRQQGQLAGHTTLFDFFNDIKKISRSAFKHPLKVFGLVAVILDVFIHQRGI